MEWPKGLARRGKRPIFAPEMAPGLSPFVRIGFEKISDARAMRPECLLMPLPNHCCFRASFAAC